MNFTKTNTIISNHTETADYRDIIATVGGKVIDNVKELLYVLVPTFISIMTAQKMQIDL